MKLETGDRVEENSVHGEDGEIKVFLSFVPAGTWLFLRTEQRAWGAGGAEGTTAAGRCQGSFAHQEQGARQKFTLVLALLSRGKCLFWINSVFLFILSEMHFTSKPERNSRNEFQFNAANIYGAPKALYLGMLAEERLKCKE